MQSIFREKLAPQVYRSLILEAHRFPGPAALEAGIVDELGGLPEVLKLIETKKLMNKAESGVYGALKADMYRATVAELDNHAANEAADIATMEANKERKEAVLEKVRKWEANGGKTKL
jgi:Delta3-Delta2-enoyl-CoA isomerase